MASAEALRRTLERQGEALDRIEGAGLRRMFRVYEDTRRELAQTLIDMEDAGLDERTPFTYQRHRSTLAQIELGMQRMAQRLGDEMRQIARAMGERTIEDTIKLLARAETDFAGVADGVEVRALERLNEAQSLNLHKHSLDRYTAETVEEIQRELLQGITRKQTFRDLRLRLFGRLSKRNAYESVWLRRQHRLSLIVQMETARASDEVHRSSIEAAADVLDVPNDPDPLMARADEYRDHRNHPLSLALHGRLRKLDADWMVSKAEVEAWQTVTKHRGPPSSITWPLHGTTYVGRTYPAHFGDRGRQTPWRQSWGDSGQQPPPTT